MIIYLRNKIKKIFFFVILLSSDQFSIPRIVVNPYIAKDMPKDISQYILAKVFNSLNNISKKTAVLAGVGTALVFSSLVGYHLYRKWKDEELQQQKDEDDKVIKELERLIEKENNSSFDFSSLSQGEKELYKNYRNYIAILRGKKIFEDIDKKIKKEITDNDIHYNDISFKKINKNVFIEKNRNIVIYIRILNEINKLLIDLIKVKNMEIENTEERLIKLEKNNNQYYQITNNPFPYYYSNQKISSDKDILKECKFFNMNHPLNKQMNIVTPKLNECDYNPLISFLKNGNYYIFWCILQANQPHAITQIRVQNGLRISNEYNESGLQQIYRDCLDAPFIGNTSEKVDLLENNLFRIKKKIKNFESRLKSSQQYQFIENKMSNRLEGARRLLKLSWINTI